MSQPPSGISIDSAFFAQYLSVANTQTNTQTLSCVISVAIGRIHAVHAMRPTVRGSAFYPPWDGKMSTSQRAMMLCGRGIKAGMV